MGIGLLGPLEVVGPQGATKLIRAKERALLAMLALHANHVVSEDRLVDGLWGDRPPRTANKTLHTYVSRLRAALAAQDDMKIETCPGGYRLEIPVSAIDTARVEDLRQQARDALASGDPAWAAVALTEALRMWRGDPLGEFADEAWAIGEATRLAELRLTTLEQRIDADLACGRHAAIVGELESLCALHPLREQLWRQRIVALYRSGRQAEALRAYQELRGTLADQLGIDPSTALQSLELAVLNHSAELDWVPVGEPPSALPPRGTELPIGVITFLLTDIEGSAGMWDAQPDAMVRALAAHDAVIGDAVGSHGGRVIKSKGEGDSTLSVFVRATDAARAALRIQRMLGASSWPEGIDLRVRIGLHTGEAELRNGDYFGGTVNRAARLRSLAAGGETVCSRATADVIADQLPPDATLVELGVRELRGLGRAEHVFMLTAQHESRASASFTGGAARVPLPGLFRNLERPPYVGRDAERARLSQALDTARAGACRVMLVAGEPGIGKTRLAIETALDAFNAGATVLYGRCDEDMGVAYQPFAEAIRHYVDHAPLDVLRRHVEGHGGELLRLVPELSRRVPDTPAPLQIDAEADRLRMFDAVAGVLSIAAERSPVFLVLDDLHWAAKATLLLLRHLARSAAPASVLIVGTYRDTEVTRTHPLTETLADLRSSGVDRVLLSGLHDDDVLNLLELLSGESNDSYRSFAQLLRSETAGNPFFVHEICRHMLESGDVVREGGHWLPVRSLEQLSLPEGVRDVIGRRLDRLGESANLALTIGAVIGTEFDIKVLERVQPVTSDTTELLTHLEDAIRARIVLEASDRPGRYRFSHSLIRQTLFEELTTTRRVRLHREIAEAIETINTDDLEPHLPALAFHFGQAALDGQAEKGASYSLRAGEAALARVAYDEAAAFAQAGLDALAVAPASNDEIRLGLTLLLANAHFRLFDPGAAKVAAMDAARTARALRSHVGLAHAALIAAEASSIGIGTKADHEVVSLCEEAALEVADDDALLRSRVLAALAQHLAAYQQTDAAVPLARESLDAARSLGDPESTALALRALLRAEAVHVERWQEVADELIAVSRAAGLLHHEAEGHGWRAGTRLAFADGDGYRHHIASFAAIAERSRSSVLRAYLEALLASQALLEGRLDEVEAHLDVLFEVGTNEPTYVLNYITHLVLLRREQRRLDELQEIASFLDDDTFGFPARSVLGVFMQTEKGDLDAAAIAYEAMARTGFDFFVDNATLLFAGFNLVAEATAALGAVSEARVLMTLVAPHVGTIMNIAGQCCTGSADRSFAMLAATIGDFDLAERRYQSALELEKKSGFDTLVARTEYWYARMLVARHVHDDLARATGLLTSAGEAAAAFGMVALAQQIRELAERTDIAPA